MVRPTVADAAHNNAAWCDAMCRAHGGTGTFAPEAWSSATRSPDLFPDAVTLTPEVDADDLLRRVDASAGCSIKDSFAALDLRPAGFRVLFDATWIGRDADAEPDAAAARWPRVAIGDAWRHEPRVALVGDHLGGAVLFRDAHAVGITNVVDHCGDLDATWRAARSAAGTYFPNAPIVGYETGAHLAAARRNGFDALGPLRVWIKD